MRYQQLLEEVKHLQTQSHVTFFGRGGKKTAKDLETQARLTATVNKYGGLNWNSTVTSRSADFTAIMGSEAVAEYSSDTQKAVAERLPLRIYQLFGSKDHPGHTSLLPFTYIHRVMGSHPDLTYNCHLMISTQNIANYHLPFMWGNMLFEKAPVSGAPDLYLLVIPEAVSPLRRKGEAYAFPEEGLTLSFGSDYMGEIKKGFLRMAMYQAKVSKGILGVHAGTKIVKARDQKDGKIKTYGVLILGLSGTGKTTNIGHTHFLEEKDEAASVVQDDFVGLCKDGRILGTEKAMYLKTDLDVGEGGDVLLVPATRQPRFYSENLYIDKEGEICYKCEDFCSNGRAVLPLDALKEMFPHRVYDSIDLPPLEELDGLYIFFLTVRDTVVPILQELNAEEAAAAFMLGESKETSAGDPSKAGQSKMEVGTNPFIVGDKATEGNMFYQFLQTHRHKVRAFLLNTGGVGEIPSTNQHSLPAQAVTRPWKDGVGWFLNGLFRNTIQWEEYPDFGTKIPGGGVLQVESRKFDPRAYYDVSYRETSVGQLNRHRLEYLKKFRGLEEKIIKGVEKGWKLF
jgi:phosphoenolpyruvate carboxykinase (ATP)